MKLIRKIHRYPLGNDFNKAVTIQIPENADYAIVSVAESKGSIQAWIELAYHDDLSARTKDIDLFLAPTGGELPENFNFVGTVVTMGGYIVIHVGELRTVYDE